MDNRKRKYLRQRKALRLNGLPTVNGKPINCHFYFCFSTVISILLEHLPLQKPLKRFSSGDTNKEKNLRLEKQKNSLLKTSLQDNNFLLFCYFSDFFSKYFLCFLKLVVDSLFYITSKVKRKFHVWLYSFFVNRSTFWSEPFPNCIF